MLKDQFRTVVAAAALALALGCPSEDDGSDPVFTTSPTLGGTEGNDESGSGGMEETSSADPTGSPSTSPTSNTATTAGTSDPTTDTATSGPVTDTMTTDPTDTMGNEAYDMCIEMAVDECETCACDNCLTELMACQGDPGCVEIRDCARANDCTGIECYGLLEPGPCRDVIDANGGPTGASTGLASTLSDCFTGNCPGC